MTNIEEKFQKIGLTYDDILLKAQYSDVDPTNVNLET
jgi:IMP dehydrogenase/GMP reductase